MTIRIHPLDKYGDITTWFSIESNFVQQNEQFHHFLLEKSEAESLKSEATYLFIITVLNQINHFTANWWDNFQHIKDSKVYIQLYEYELTMNLRLIQKLNNPSLSAGNRIFEFRLNLDQRIRGNKEEIFGKKDVILRGIFQLGTEIIEPANKKSREE